MNNSKEQSIKSQVKTISLKQHRKFNDIWHEVILERWLARLANSPYRKNFIFKGAMCLLQYIAINRETRDLDFLLKDLQGSIETIRRCFNEVSTIDLNDGFSFDEIHVGLLEHAHMKYPGYSLSTVSHIGKTKTKIFIDIGVGDAVRPTEITMQLLATEKAPLFEKEIELWAYPVESIFAEKLETIIARGNQNSRMKDYLDLIYLISSNVLKIESLKTMLSETFANRKTQIQIIQFKNSEIEKVQNYWSIYHEGLNPEIKKNISNQIREIIGEINTFVLQHNLI